MRRRGLIALAAVAGLVVVVVAATQIVGGPSGGDNGFREDVADLTVHLGGEDSAREALAEQPASGGPVTGSFSDDGYVAGSGGAGGDALPLPEVAGRKIVRNASVSLSVEDVGASVQSVESIASAAGGFVSESSIFVEPQPEPLDGDSEPPRRSQSATLTIRVPSTSYASVMQQLRGLADEVESETSTTSDVSEEFSDLEARLRNLEATEARYLELLEMAETIPDILTLQDRINSVRLEIERIQGRMNLLNDLSDLATIVVQLRPQALVVEEPSEPGWAQEVWEDAWDTSKNALQALGTAAIVIGVVLAWLAVPAVAIAVAWRLFGPRRERSGQA